MSAWNTYFISENCGANIDFLFLKQWFYGILFWNMKEVALWGDQSYINGERNNGLSFFVWGYMEPAEEIVSSWWECSLLMDITTNLTWSGQQERWSESESRSPGCTMQQDGVISALPLLTHGTLRTQGAPKVLMIYSNTDIKMSWQRIWICTCCYS